jgi:lipoprotein-anchoring transpeptidase ErfK/SrfK
MPHCMFFYKGYAIHGSGNIPNENKSHGCIRITKKAAEWVSNNYINPGSLVIVMPYHDTAG